MLDAGAVAARARRKGAAPGSRALHAPKGKASGRRAAEVLASSGWGGGAGGGGGGCNRCRGRGATGVSVEPVSLNDDLWLMRSGKGLNTLVVAAA